MASKDVRVEVEKVEVEKEFTYKGRHITITKVYKSSAHPFSWVAHISLGKEKFLGIRCDDRDQLLLRIGYQVCNTNGVYDE